MRGVRGVHRGGGGARRLRAVVRLRLCIAFVLRVASSGSGLVEAVEASGAAVGERSVVNDLRSG